MIQGYDTALADAVDVCEDWMAKREYEMHDDGHTVVFGSDTGSGEGDLECMSTELGLPEWVGYQLSLLAGERR